jgi:hypothetical protein
MKITRVSPFSGETNTLEIDVTQEQLDALALGSLIQDVMPKLTPGEREFILTGTTEAEWDEVFKEEE